MTTNTNNPAFNNPTAPKRARVINDLILAILLSANEVEDYRDNPDEVNSALALCEIATALPLEWFTAEERALVVALVRELHGNFAQFILSIACGDISYVNKQSEKMHGSEGKTCEQVVKNIRKAQEEYLARE